MAHVVSNTDPRFRGKVVLINITGSWCPNCHDEAPFLAALYNKYHDQGLEVVALSFEEADQLKNPTRLKAFIKEYGIKYTVLLGGETDSAKAKLTQAVNWDAWPTTFFVGRDGLVRGAHAGFPSPGSGELYKQEKDEFVAKVEKLLAENQLAPVESDSQAFLLLQVAEAADIGDREREFVLRVVHRAEIEAPVFGAETATIGVVSHLHDRELLIAETEIVNGRHRRVPAFAVRIPISDLRHELIRGRINGQRWFQDIAARGDEILLVFASRWRTCCLPAGDRADHNLLATAR